MQSEHASTTGKNRRYPIGTLGQLWGDAERKLWRDQLARQRSYADDVLKPLQQAADAFAVSSYGEVTSGHERFALMAVKSRNWREGLPCALITGGVHGYETSGVKGALRFVLEHAAQFADRVNLLVAPCVSPWAYERVQRWNHDALDPNRNFFAGTKAHESAALVQLVASTSATWTMHIDLHETTNSDESEFRPALAARDGKPFQPGTIPDGFYVVDDSKNPQPAFQKAIIDAVAQVTHIAPADAKGEIIGAAVVAPGVIHYDVRGLYLCAGLTGARFTCTTEVYPDSARATPEQCIQAQVAAVLAGLRHAFA